MITSKNDPENYTLIKRAIEEILNTSEVKLIDFVENLVRLEKLFLWVVDKYPISMFFSKTLTMKEGKLFV